MKPIFLTVSAFGPYATKQVFDFRELGERSFFLIHGPTGAGKTTILDAICYALYGDTSGAERKGEQMRSQHAPADTPTEVTFDFALGNATYRVTRSPEQERPKKRGGGTTTQPATATLWGRTGIADDSLEGTVLANQPSKVTERIEAIFGFRSDQFRQVIMLPQGKFRELLAANSNQREEILEALFQTEVYRRIQDALKEKAKETQQKVEAVQTQRRFILDQATAETPTQLEEQRKQSEAALLAIRGRLVTLREAEKQASTRLTQAHQTNDKIKELDDARKAMSDIEARRAESDQKQISLTLAKKAASLHTAESTLNIRTNDAAQRRQEVQIANQAHEKAVAEKKTAATLLGKEQARQTDRDALASEMTRLRDLDGKVKALAQAKATYNEAKTSATKLKADHAKAKEALNLIQPQIDEQNEALTAIREAAASLDGMKLAETQAGEHVKNLREFDSVQRQLTEAKAKHDVTTKSLTRARLLAKNAKTSYSQLQQQWMEGQAAIFAKHLVKGEPCSVCGSKDHPAPAKSKHILPDETAIQQKLQECENAEQAVATSEQEERATSRTVERLESRHDSLKEALGAMADKSVETMIDKLKTATSRRQKAEEAAKSIPEVSKAIQALKRKLLQSQNEVEQLDKDQKAAAEKSDEMGGVLKGLERGIPEELRNPVALSSAIKKAAEVAKQLKEAFENAQERAGAADKALAACVREKQTAEITLKKALETLASVQETFAEKLKEEGFADQKAYQQAKRSSAEIIALEGDINLFEQHLQTAKDRVERATQAAASLVRANIKTLEEAVSTAKTNLEAAITDEANLAKTCKQMKQWLDALRKADEELQRLEKEFSVYGRLSEVANGKNARGMTLQRFVLGWLLDDVLNAASIRLRTMSRGRYELQRMRERIDQRSASGLDVEVFDGYTGMNRAIATLSGGEGFLASLALALGLADVVQTYAGGVRLETMFVDEGFGSLDPESMDLAIRSLIDLQHGGRLVGIISHVSELRERIDARLEIKSDRLGSSARFVVA